MAKSFRELTGASPSTASPSDSTLIIDAQNEYVSSSTPKQCFCFGSLLI